VSDVNIYKQYDCVKFSVTTMTVFDGWKIISEGTVVSHYNVLFYMHEN
jgi:uncharacterized membrane protein